MLDTRDNGRATWKSRHCQCQVGLPKIPGDFWQPGFSIVESERCESPASIVASTGTKNPNYPDTLYVDQLIGPDTVNTMPEATFAAFRDHGTVKPTIQEGLEEAKTTMQQLADVGISMDAVTQTLLVDGAKLFGDAFTN